MAGEVGQADRSAGGNPGRDVVTSIPIGKRASEALMDVVNQACVYGRSVKVSCVIPTSSTKLLLTACRRQRQPLPSPG